ncbi:MAG: hypothetical protein M1837_003045 [Sclerophora amabilis]|nr:MAG: hypothetical protein M1837_003045 [Sclerophora amabilis]
MTTYIPSITLPGALFAQPAASILLPIGLGMGVAFAIPRIKRNKQKVYGTEATAVSTSAMDICTHVDDSIWSDGVFSLSSLEYWTRIAKPAHSSIDQVPPAQQQGATLYTIQLGLNLIFMPLFFGFGRPIEATVDIVALTGVTGYLIYTWSQVDQVAAWALVPYLGWLSFATYLSAGIGYLNGWDTKGKGTGKPKPKDTLHVNEKATGKSE